MYRNGSRKKFRTGMAVDLAELRADKPAARELNTEMLMHPGYVGFADDPEMQLRIYVFTSKESTEEMLKTARKMGFRTAGSIEQPFHVRNADLERPHLRYVSKYNWHKELYK